MAIVRPIADAGTPKLAAYSGVTGTIEPNPSWLTAISTHIQINTCRGEYVATCLGAAKSGAGRKSSHHEDQRHASQNSRWRTPEIGECSRPRVVGYLSLGRQ